jgi:ketosteroid isomerase-like protein
VSEQERIELVRRAMAAISRRNTSAFLAEVADDCELQPLMSVWPQPYRGHDGIERWFEDLAAVWDAFSVEPEEIRVLDDDTLLVTLLWKGRGKGRQDELSGPAVALWRFRDDKAVSARLYPDETRALEAYDADKTSDPRVDS